MLSNQLYEAQGGERGEVTNTAQCQFIRAYNLAVTGFNAVRRVRPLCQKYQLHLPFEARFFPSFPVSVCDMQSACPFY